MFTERQLQILAYLSSSDRWTLGSTLASMLNVSKRTLQIDIKKINEQLSGKTRILSNNRFGYLLEDRDGLFDRKPQEERQLNPHGAYGRSKQILMLLLFEKDYISIGHMADKLYISKSTISSCLAQVRRVIGRTPGARLQISSNRGIRILASESVKRIMCMKCMDTRVDYASILNLHQFDQIYVMEETLSSIVAKQLVRHTFIVTGEAFHDLVKYIAIGMFRTRLGFEEEMPLKVIDIPDLLSEILNEVGQEISYEFTPAETQYIAARIQELNLVQKPKSPDRSIVGTLDEFLNSIREQTGYQLHIDKELQRNFADHILRMKRRIESGRNNIGNNTKELCLRYPLEFHLLKTCLSPILGVKIPDAELDYLIYYLASAIDTTRKKLKVLLVTDSSAGSIYEMERLLKYYIAEKITAIRAVPLYLYSQMEEAHEDGFPVLITTEKELALKDKRFRLIDEFASPDQMEQIRRQVYQMDQDRTLLRRKELSAKYFHELVKSSDIEKMENELRKTLSLLEQGKNERTVSAESIGDNVLYVISHEIPKTNRICRFSTRSPVKYQGKQITKVVTARYGGEGDLIEFFDLLRHVLSISI